MSIEVAVKHILTYTLTARIPASMKGNMAKTGTRALSVGGGKGGTGKSCFTANIGYALARRGKKVILVDTDFEGANLHTFVGISYPKQTLDDYFRSSTKNIEEIILPTPVSGLRLISAPNNLISLSGPNYVERQRFYRAVMNIDADIIIFDVSAGSGMRVIDYFSIAPVMVLMLEPVPTALENAYGFLKNFFCRHLLRSFYSDKPAHRIILDVMSDKNSRSDNALKDLLAILDRRSHEKTEQFRTYISSLKHIYLVVNKVRTREQREVIDRFARIVKRYLMLNLRAGGALPLEPEMDKSITERTPFIQQNPEGTYAQAMDEIIINLSF